MTSPFRMIDSEIGSSFRFTISVAGWFLGPEAARGQIAGELSSIVGTEAAPMGLAVDRLTGGLRSVSRSPGLRRALGGSDTLLRGIHVVVPAIGFKMPGPLEAALGRLLLSPLGAFLQ